MGAWRSGFGAVFVVASTISPPLFAQEEEEVTVRGRRNEIGGTKMTANDVREMPGAFGDPFRAIEAMPGVTPVLSGLPYFFIRGAPPNNNGFYVDGVRVPLLFHLGLGPSVIHPALLDHVDFYPGAAPANYGRFAGAVIAGETRRPSSEPLHGAANLRLVDAGALVEAPFGADDRGSALVAGRYGYPGPIIHVLAPETTVGYWDYQSRVSWRVDDKGSTLTLFGFGSHDYLSHIDSNSRGGEPASGKEIEDFVSDFHRVDLRYDRLITEGHMRVAATFGYDSQGASPSYLDDTSGAVRLDIERRLSPSLRVRGGADARLDKYKFNEGEPPDAHQAVVPSSVSPAPTNVTWGAHADVVWRVNSRFEVVPGARIDMYESARGGEHTRIPAFDPRLSTRVTLAPSRVFWVSSFGLAHQYPTLRVGSMPAAVVSGAGFPLGLPSKKKQLQRVAQASEGIEVALPLEMTASATAFLSGWTSLTDLTAQCFQIEPAVVGPAEPGTREQAPYFCPNEDPVHGRTFGAELLVRRPLSKRLSGWVSYTLSRTTREAHFVTVTGGQAVATVPSEFDRTHVLNAVLAYDLGRRWRAGGRFVFYSGQPFSPYSGNVPVPPYNSFRDPPFIRVDVRVEKRWQIGKTGSIAFVIEGQNVTLSKETSALGIDCEGQFTPEGGTNKCKRAEVGPITIPSIGVEAFF